MIRTPVLDLEKPDENTEQEHQYTCPQQDGDSLLGGRLDRGNHLGQDEHRCGEKTVYKDKSDKGHSPSRPILTEGRDDLCLQTELIAEAGSDKSLRGGVRRASDTVPHVSTGEHQNGDDAHRGPQESRGEEWRKVLVAQESDSEDERDDHRCNDVRNRVERLVDLEFVGRERCDPVVQVVQLEAAIRVC